MRLILLILILSGCATRGHNHDPKPVDPCSFVELQKKIKSYDAEKLTSSELQMLVGAALSVCRMGEITKSFIRGGLSKEADEAVNKTDKELGL